MALRPGGAKAKGAEGERELALLLRGFAQQAGVTDLDLTRNLDQSRGGGHDLVGLEAYGMAVEVKRVETVDLNSWWRQAVRQAEAVQCTPVLAWRQNRQPWRFRVRAWVYPVNAELDIDLDLLQFRIWFIARLAHLPIGGRRATLGMQASEGSDE
jgi:Holliday junction resolvase